MVVVIVMVNVWWLVFYLMLFSLFSVLFYFSLLRSCPLDRFSSVLLNDSGRYLSGV